MSPADDSLKVGVQTLRVTLGKHRGRVGVDVRFWFSDKTTGRLRAGLRGVTLPAHAAPWLVQALEQVIEHLRKDGYMQTGVDPLQVRLNPAAYPTQDW